MFDRKGQMRTVEAFLSILLLFSALTVATSLSPPNNSRDDAGLAFVGLQTLVSIDSQGHLGVAVDNRNWTALSDSLNSLLPTGIAYNLSIYDGNMKLLNNISISNGMISDGSVAAVQYPCASPSPQNQQYLLQLQLAIVG